MAQTTTRLVGSSFVFYLLLAWIDVIILAVAAFRRPTGKRWIGAVGIITNVLVCLLLPSVIGLMFYSVLCNALRLSMNRRLNVIPARPLSSIAALRINLLP
ncbi:MAG: hypothetical protein KF726_12030 [Anaerolineae bacterium]|nr:hypothetical protein [Anaerolineae bacterium]